MSQSLDVAQCLWITAMGDSPVDYRPLENRIKFASMPACSILFRERVPITSRRKSKLASQIGSLVFSGLSRPCPIEIFSSTKETRSETDDVQQQLPLSDLLASHRSLGETPPWDVLFCFTNDAINDFVLHHSLINFTRFVWILEPFSWQLITGWFWKRQ